MLDLRRQCVEKRVAFRFHQTGAYFVKDGRTYRIMRKYQLSQAHKAGIDYGIDGYFAPEKADTEGWS